MKNKLHPNYKPNKIRLELMNKLAILEEYASGGLLYIDEVKGFVAISQSLFNVESINAVRFKSFLTNVFCWMSFERSRKEVNKYTREQLNSMKELPLPPSKPFDFNVISERGQCLVVGRFDGNNFHMMPYEETKEKAKETFSEL